MTRNLPGQQPRDHIRRVAAQLASQAIEHRIRTPHVLIEPHQQTQRPAHIHGKRDCGRTPNPVDTG